MEIALYSLLKRLDDDEKNAEKLESQKRSIKGRQKEREKERLEKEKEKEKEIRRKEKQEERERNKDYGSGLLTSLAISSFTSQTLGSSKVPVLLSSASLSSMKRVPSEIEEESMSSGRWNTKKSYQFQEDEDEEEDFI
jgi:hypothetical protein